MNSGSYTRYLTAHRAGAEKFIVRILASTPISILQPALNDSLELRYSPIMPAFLVPDSHPPAAPDVISSIAFFFHSSPYKALGLLKSTLTREELPLTYFTEGLASILILNLSRERVKELRTVIGNCPVEEWHLTSEGELPTSNIFFEMSPETTVSDPVVLPITAEPELSVYVEQIGASIGSLWAAYSRYLPEEIATLRQLIIITKSLLDQYAVVTKCIVGENPDNLVHQRKANAIVSALVELSATLSYGVTQGTSGSAPILWNRSPFPHHSLLGIGGSIRALTRFTRYLETAFMVRSAGKVIGKQYSCTKESLPVSIPTYTSGPSYKLPEHGTEATEYFDRGGDFRQDDQVPLLAHFSLRHGFMESKFSVTAASESLTAETMPQWTLMTLSHEVMHSRVRTIFQALFGSDWSEDSRSAVRPEVLSELLTWINSAASSSPVSVDTGLRNVILMFCYAIEKALNPVAAKEDKPGNPLSANAFVDAYCHHKQLAIETVVHFHDYYFAYAYHPQTYIKSVWASWIKVAPPFIRTREYLVRSLATVACGKGLHPTQAFEFAVEELKQGLSTLESSGIRSPLFAELRRLVTDPGEAEKTRAYFKPFNYLMDHVRLFFASTIIAKQIDRITSDPFAEGSISPEDYSASIYVFPDGEEASPSPIRYSLAALFRTLSGKPCAADAQWLTAWNYMVISS